MSISIAVPSRRDQDSIISALEGEVSALATAIDQAHGEASLLGEYRTRLIADVVTGKLDVREAAARLLDEAEEPEPLEEDQFDVGVDENGIDDVEADSEEVDA